MKKKTSLHSSWGGGEKVTPATYTDKHVMFPVVIDTEKKTNKLEYKHREQWQSERKLIFTG